MAATSSVRKLHNFVSAEGLAIAPNVISAALGTEFESIRDRDKTKTNTDY